ncbi:MAG: dihydrodipicolinate synthase family protein [Ktedonobacteraceae bacterium]|nr:dihydrodipicolinate synthase family protein [Ktedonobacteraceae bacterium]
MATLSHGFGGIVPPLCTPLTESFEVDTQSLRRLIEFQLAAGVHGLFVLGSSGETAFLTDKQRATVLDVAVHTVAGQVPVLAGVIDMTTARTLEHARDAQRAGVDGLIVTAPFYTRASQVEVIEHFRIIHSALDLPLFAYDIPVAVHTKISYDTTFHLASEGLIAGVKDSSEDVAGFRALIMAQKSLNGFLTFTGSELLVDVALQMGASGSVPGLANVDPEGYVRLYQAAQAGDWQTARREQERLCRLFSIVSVGTTGRMGTGSSAMGGFKTALLLLGVISTNVVGRPMIRLNKEELERVRELLVGAELL